jgi:hypothetical protein
MHSENHRGKMIWNKNPESFDPVTQESHRLSQQSQQIRKTSSLEQHPWQTNGNGSEAQVSAKRAPGAQRKPSRWTGLQVSVLCGRNQDDSLARERYQGKITGGRCKMVLLKSRWNVVWRLTAEYERQRKQERETEASAEGRKSRTRKLAGVEILDPAWKPTETHWMRNQGSISRRTEQKTNPWPVATWVARVPRKERKTIIKIPGALCLNPCGDERPLCSNPWCTAQERINEWKTKQTPGTAQWGNKNYSNPVE